MINFVSVNSFKFGEDFFNFFEDETGNIWFVGKEVLGKLGYNDLDKPLRKFVSDNNKVSISKDQFNKSLKNIASATVAEASVPMESGNEKDLDITSMIWSNDKDFMDKVFINESGFYELMTKSEKKEAKPFADWVYKDVLPTIRKTGKYEMNVNNNPFTVQPKTQSSVDINAIFDKLQDIVSTELANELSSVQNQMLDIKNQVYEQSSRLKDQSSQVNFLKSAVIRMNNGFYSNAEYSNNYNPIKLYSDAELADEFNLDENYLRQILVNINGLMINDGKYNNDTRYRATDTVIENGFAVIMPYTDQRKCPGKYFYRWTEYGRETIFNYLKANNMIDPFIVL